jgi:2-C-methyl-D-erythritol 4-phosphate cytidylyltransferase
MPASAYSAIVAAGGSSRRFGGAGASPAEDTQAGAHVPPVKNKLREKVGGKAVLSHSLDKFADDDECVEVILCAGPAVREWIETNPLVFSGSKLRVVDGGASRAESVRNGVEAAKSEYIAIHDGARPNFHPDLLAQLKRAVDKGVGAVPALAVSDTLAYISATGESKQDVDFFGRAVSTSTGGAITSYVERAGLYALQTPQFFERESYLDALGKAGELAQYSDDSALYIAGGYQVITVTGSPTNIKLTTPDDLHLLLKLMGGGEKKGKDKYGGLGW